MDNDQGNFEAFQKENVVLVFFTPNIKRCKRPCNLGVIAAVIMWYKLFFSKYVLSFFQMDNGNQQLLKEQVSKFLCWVSRFWGSVGVRYGRPATLLDSANYAKEEWYKVTEKPLKMLS